MNAGKQNKINNEESGQQIPQKCIQHKDFQDDFIQPFPLNQIQVNQVRQILNLSYSLKHNHKKLGNVATEFV